MKKKTNNNEPPHRYQNMGTFSSKYVLFTENRAVDCLMSSLEQTQQIYIQFVSINISISIYKLCVVVISTLN